MLLFGYILTLLVSCQNAFKELAILTAFMSLFLFLVERPLIRLSFLHHFHRNQQRLTSMVQFGSSRIYHLVGLPPLGSISSLAPETPHSLGFSPASLQFLLRFLYWPFLLLHTLHSWTIFISLNTLTPWVTSSSPTCEGYFMVPHYLAKRQCRRLL